MQGCYVSHSILNGGAIPDRKIMLGEYGEISLVTVGDSTFPRFSWLIKCYDESTRNSSIDISTKCFVVLVLFLKTRTEC